jgi:hypothetical protein
MPQKKKRQKTAISGEGRVEGPLYRAASGPKDPPAVQTLILDSYPHLLADLLSPALTPADFLGRYFRRQAVHVPSTQGGARVESLRHRLFDLNVQRLMEETASESIFVWLQSNQSPGEDKKINSIEVSDIAIAHALYQAGHPTYCRAPPDFEEFALGALLENTGLGCGQYDATGQSMTSMGRAEVEVFISTTNGHKTGWHTDFQENFTVQLSGRKRWRLQRGTVAHVVRGITPHYAVSSVEGQVKAGRLDQEDFAFGPPTVGVNATGPVEEVVLEAGDVLYFPAGMWHQIEVLEPGVSINCSLMATNYATLVCQSLQHVLLRRPEWRASICRPVASPTSSKESPAPTVTDTLQGLLQQLPEIISEWTQQYGAAQGILPPVLQHGRIDAEEDGIAEPDESVDASSSMDEQGSEVDDPIVDLSEEPPSDFDLSPATLAEKLKTQRLTRNPLALMLNEQELLRHYKPTNGSTDGQVYILNVNYAGNEGHQSHFRVRLQSDEAKLDRLSVDEIKPTVLAWLVYFGYFVWVPR